METCKICNLENPEFSHFWKEHRTKASDYYFQFFPKFDLLTGEKLEFKTKEQYFSFDFNSRDNLKGFLFSKSSEEVKIYCQNLFKKLKENRNLTYSPTQVELRSIIAPPVNFINKYFGDYIDFCNKIGLKNRFSSNVCKYSLKVELKDEIIQCDTREQNGLDLNAEIATLPYGDYCLKNNKKVYIERKSLTDFIGTFGKDIQRFENEITRAAEDGVYLIIIVEEDISKCLKFNELAYVSKKIKVSPEFIFHNIRELLQKYNNIQFLFVANRAESARMVKKILYSGEDFKHFDAQLSYDLQQL